MINIDKMDRIGASVYSAKLSSTRFAGMVAGLQLALLLSALDQTILNTAIPKLATSLHGMGRSALVISSYLLFSTIVTPIAGKLADIFGARAVLLSAVLLFAATSALCGSAGLIPQLFGLDGMNQLILFRALQGISGGAMLGLCFITVGDLFPARERARYQGFLAAAFIVAAIVGPILGGWLTDAFSWRFIFYINIPLGIISAVFISTCYPDSLRQRAQPIIDYAGIVLLILCIAPLILSSTEVGHIGAFNYISVSELLLSLLMFVLLIWRERTAKEPLIPLKLFADRLISISLITVFVTGIGLFGSMLLLALVLQKVFGTTATMSGMALSPLMILVAGASIIGGLVLARTGRYKVLVIISLCVLCAGSIMLSTLTPASSMSLFLMQSALAGVGLGLILPIHTIIVQNAVSGSVMGVSTSMTQFVRSLGGTIGTGMLSALMLNWLKQDSLQEAISHVLLIYGLIVFLTLIINLFLPETDLKKTGF